MKAHPSTIDWDAPITMSQFAELVDGDISYIGRIGNRGILPKGASALQWFQLYCKHMRLKAAGKSGAESNLSEERAELTKVQREIAEIQLMVKRAEFAPVSSITRQVSKIVSGLSTRLTAIPRELQKHHPEMSVAQVQRVQAIVANACQDAVRLAIESMPLEEDEEESVS